MRCSDRAAVGAFDKARWLVGAIGTALAAGHAAGDGVAETLMRLDAQDPAPPASPASDPRRLPACRFFAETVAEAALLASDVAAALAACEDQFHWQQNQSYSDALLGPGYMADYAYAEIIGPRGFLAGDDFLLGLLILGPNRLYRDHHHLAPELYWLLTGPTEWSRNGGQFTAREAGHTVWHPPRMVHATRTLQAPLLAVWAWTRDTGTPARLVGA